MSKQIPDESKYDWFLIGLKERYPICCILFFSFEWQIIKQTFHEYNIINHNGYVRCPNCIKKEVEKF